jgi:predicted NUDIX family phosphoesterase
MKEIDNLIDRAKNARSRYDISARKPFVIEFAGVPKAGKTSTISQIAAFFKRCGFRVEIVIERASVCPIRDKKHANFNIWTACTTLAHLLEKTQDPPKADDPQILILDRGIFDSLCWLAMMERLARIRKPDREKVEHFLLIDDWRKRISGVVVMTALPEHSLERERGELPVPGSAGSIMNKEVLEQMRNTTTKVAEKYKKYFRIFSVDTSSKKYNKNPRNTCEAIVDQMLSWIEEHLREDVLYVNGNLVLSHFQNETSLQGKQAQAIEDVFCKKGKYKSREEVEANASLIQALPVVIVRNKSGEILQLRRREKSDDSPLHEKLVIWAGGHVRSEDNINGNPLLHAAHRELQEELRLDVDEEKLKLLGAVYVNNGGKTRQHVAIVYEWQAETDDVAVSLSSAEFFERRGTSLSGKFVQVSDLIRALEPEKDKDKSTRISEPWTVEIIRKLLPDTKNKVSRELF